MKKIIAVVLSIVMICCLAVTAFATPSPVAGNKVTVTFKKADAGVTMNVAHTLEKGSVITVKANTQQSGQFNSWSVYKVAADGKYVEAVAGVDYEIVAGTLTAEEVSVKLISDVVVCGNYNGTVTDPAPEAATGDGSSTAPQTGDMTMAYVFVVLAVAAFGFGAKKVYSK